MAGIDELRTDVRQRANDFLASLTAGGAAAIPGFGMGPMLVLGSLGTRQADTGTVNATPQPINQALTGAVVNELNGRLPVPITEDEARQALELLRTGQFHDDVAQGIRAVLMLVRLAPQSAIETIIQAPHLPVDLLEAVRQDALEALDPDAVRAFLRDVKDGRINDPPNFLRNTLRVVLTLATLGEVVQTVRALIAEDNGTFRLALIVYARSQGIDLEPEDLDALRAALDPANPNLGVLFDRGLQYIRRRTGGPGEASEIIQRLGFLNP